MVIQMQIGDVPVGTKVYCPIISKREVVVVDDSRSHAVWVTMQVNGSETSKYVPSSTQCYVDDQDLKCIVRGWFND